MFREMRRSKQAMTSEECIAVLNRGTSGVLAVWGDDDYPYAVPLSYLYEDSKLYFHCAADGHKTDAIKNHPKVSFCVTDQDQVVSQEYTTYYRSVICFGRARILESEEEKKSSLEKLAAKYTPEDEAGRLREVEQSLKRVCMVEITIESMTGKEAKELKGKNPTYSNSINNSINNSTRNTAPQADRET